MHKSNKIYILVQEQDHLLPLCYYDNFMFFEKLTSLDFTLPHIITFAKSMKREALPTGVHWV